MARLLTTLNLTGLWFCALTYLVSAHALAAENPPSRPCHTAWGELSKGATVTGPAHFASTQGELITPAPAILNVAASDRVYRLGEGLMGGTVYRIVPAQGSPYVLKVYNQISSALGDIDSFEYWRGLELDEFVRLARYSLPPNSAVMRIESIEGMTVEALLQNPLVDPATQGIVRARYQQLLNNFVERVAFTSMNIIHRRVEQNAAYFTLDHRLGQNIGIALKPDNVIVDAQTLELVLVDPF